MNPRIASLEHELRQSGDWREPAMGSLALALEAPEDVLAQSRWVLALQVVGAWVAALCVLAFLGFGVGALIKSASGWLVLGGGLTALCGFALTQMSGVVVRQFILAASLAGHGALLVGAGSLGSSAEASAYFSIAAYEALLLFWVGWWPHRLVAALLVCLAPLCALLSLDATMFVRYLPAGLWLVAVGLWLTESRWLALKRAAALEALAFCAGLVALWFAFLGRGWVILFSGARATDLWLPALLCMVSLCALLWLARPCLRSVRLAVGLGLLLGALALAWQTPALAMGSFLLAVGVMRGRTMLAAFGGVVFVLALGKFYYDLNTTLLLKSGYLVLGGVLLLLARALLVSESPRSTPEEA